MYERTKGLQVSWPALFCSVVIDSHSELGSSSYSFTGPILCYFVLKAEFAIIKKVFSLLIGHVSKSITPWNRRGVNMTKIAFPQKTKPNVHYLANLRKRFVVFYILRAIFQEKGVFSHFLSIVFSILEEREAAISGAPATGRELALPDVAMEAPSCIPDDYLYRGAGPSAEVTTQVTSDQGVIRINFFLVIHKLFLLFLF